MAAATHAESAARPLSMHYTELWPWTPRSIVDKSTGMRQVTRPRSYHFFLVTHTQGLAKLIFIGPIIQKRSMQMYGMERSSASHKQWPFAEHTSRISRPTLKLLIS